MSIIDCVFFIETATTEIYTYGHTLSLHVSLPISGTEGNLQVSRDLNTVLSRTDKEASNLGDAYIASELFLLALADDKGEAGRLLREAGLDRKSNRLNSSH